MSLLRRLADRGSGVRVDEPFSTTEEPEAPSRIRRASGVRSGNVAPGQMAALPENYLLDIVTNQDRIPERSRLGGTASGLMHVSSLVDACARREVLAQRFPEEVWRSVAATDRIIWKIGRAVEAHIREQFISATDGASLYGRWVCRCGHTHHVGMRPHRQVCCTRCQTPRTIYEEHPVVDEENGLIGNADMPFMVGDYLVLGEIKSMKREDWEKLKAPMANHIVQVATYRRMYERAGWKVHDRAIIIYASKAAVKGSPYKEFSVDCISRRVQVMVDEVLDAGRIIKEYVSGGDLPARIDACKTMDSTKAKSCPKQGQCWNL